MKPLKLKLAAFEPYVEKMELDFEKYLSNKKMFLIHGETGAGKTSILDAICFALYGDSCGGERKSNMLRSEQASPKVETYVDFTFSLGHKKYRIIRKPRQIVARKSGVGTKEQEPTAQLYSVDEFENEKLLEERVTNVNNKIEELIGFKSDQFRQVVFLPQGRFQRFLTADSKDREVILKILFKTDFYEKLENELNERSKNKRDELENYRIRRHNILEESNVNDEDELSHWIATKTEELKAATKQETELKAAREDANTKLKEGEQLNKKFNDMEQKLREVEDAQSNLDRIKKAFASAKNEYDNRKGEEPKRTKLETDINSLKKVQQAVGDLDSIREQLNAETEKSKQAEKEFKEADELANKCEQLLNKLKLDKEGYIKEAAKLSEAQKKLDDCNKRDDLTKELVQDKKALEAAENAFKIANDKWLAQQAKVEELNEQWRAGSAANLAANLQDGEPCPVCGAVHHPKLAQSTTSTPSDTEIKNANNLLKKLDNDKSNSKDKVTALKTTITEKQRQLDDKKDVGDTKAAQKELKEAQRAADDLKTCTDRIAKGEKKTKQAKDDREIKQKARDNATKLVATLQGSLNTQLKHINAELEPFNLTLDQLDNAIKNQERQLSILKKAWADAEKNFNLLSNQLEGAKKTLLIKSEDLEKIKVEIEGKKKPDIEVLNKNLKEVDMKLSEQIQLIASLKTNLQQQKNRLDKLNDIKAQSKKLEEQYKTWSMLADVACGKRMQGAEGYKISFSRYALQSKLAKVIDAANQRLKIMSNGAYELRNKTEARSRAAAAGLELEIYHAYHGTTRAVETLSGGESFLASLSLAMGLADAVQTQYGGRSLETIFIDEGFGTLDNEKLKKAIESLVKLQEGGRLVGIISHVEALKSWLSVRLEVTKRDVGSEAKFIET